MVKIPNIKEKIIPTFLLFNKNPSDTSIWTFVLQITKLYYKRVIFFYNVTTEQYEYYVR